MSHIIPQRVYIWNIKPKGNNKNYSQNCEDLEMEKELKEETVTTLKSK